MSVPTASGEMDLTDGRPREETIPAPTSELIIDTDVHERKPPLDALLPFLDPVWKHQLTSPAWTWLGSAIELNPYIAPIQTARNDWLDPNGVPMSGNAETVGRLLFEKEGVGIAILNGFFHVSTMKTDVELAAALAAAYNDWQIAYWLDVDDRFKGSIHVHAGDPLVAAREIDRVAEHPGIVQVFLPLDTDRQYGDPFYRPIFEAAVRHGLVVAFHHGSATQTILGHPRYYIEWHTLAAPQSAMGTLSSLVFNGVFDAYPELKAVFLETGVSWLPWFMWRADQQYRELRASVPWLKRLPSAHIRDSVRLSTQPVTEVTSAELTKLIEMTDSDRIYMFATDFPHYDADSTTVLSGLSPELKSRIYHQNALETYSRLATLR